MAKGRAGGNGYTFMYNGTVMLEITGADGNHPPQIGHEVEVESRWYVVATVRHRFANEGQGVRQLLQVVLADIPQR